MKLEENAMRKIIINYTSQSKYTAKDYEGRAVKAFEFTFDDRLLAVLEKAKTEDLVSFKVKGQLFTDTGVKLAECSLEVIGEQTFISYDGYLGNPARFELFNDNDHRFESIACDFQEELDISK